MPRLHILMPLLGIALALAGCTAQEAVAPIQKDGWIVYSGDHVAVHAVCGAMPIRLTGSHTQGYLTGACAQVELTGNHNDVDVSMAPGGSFTILGDSNDVWWTPSTPGATPTLTIRGQGDAFHRALPQ
ncbi:MAG: DUF3060 domain-containing protein [Rhodospirillales bacterium]|nr:DUF3060 domain-containing protein [Rhodospirillales bacterium]